MIVVPRSLQEILAQADKLAEKFEQYEPNEADERDPAIVSALRQAAVARADAELQVQRAVHRARAKRYSWAFIGGVLGTSGEAARQRYSKASVNSD